MKNRTYLFFTILLATSNLLYSQTITYDFSSVSPSGHKLYYTVTNSTFNKVELVGWKYWDMTDTVGMFMIVPENVSNNGTTYTVASIGRYFSGYIYYNGFDTTYQSLGGPYSLASDIDIVVQLPASIDTVKEYSFRGLNVPVFHSTIPPIIDSLAVSDCNNVLVPCGSQTAYLSVLGNSMQNKIHETLPFNITMPIYGNMSCGRTSIYMSSLCDDSTTSVSVATYYNDSYYPYKYYQFSYWWDGTTSTDKTVHITSDTSLAAFFEKKQSRTYTINTYGTPGTINGPTTAPWGDTVTLTAHANYGYEFVRWKYPYVYDSIIYDSVLYNDTIYHYSYTRKKWRYEYTTDSTLSYAVLLWPYAYDPDGYYDDSQYYSATAEFQKKNYTTHLLSDNLNKGVVHMQYYYESIGYGIWLDWYFDSIVLPYQTMIKIRAVANTGYQFTHWSDGDTNEVRYITMTQDTLLVAYFEGLPVNVTIINENPELGSVVGAGAYHYGDTVTLIAQPVDHYHFSTWEQYCNSQYNYYSDNPLEFVITQDTIFSVLFEIDRHHVEVSANNIAYGSVYGTNDYEYGTAATIRAYPYSGYQFIRWNNGVTYNPYTLAVLCDTSLTAIFAEEGTTYVITGESADPSMGSVTGGSNYALGEQATLTALPNSGYIFDHWQDNNTENPRTITVTSDATYTAYFVETQGIDDVFPDAVNIYTLGGRIVVETELKEEIGIYDIVGHKVDGGRKNRYDVPASGVYLVKVGSLSPVKVIVVK